MMARVTDALTAAPISLHFTRLRGDGSGKAEVEKAKLLLTGHRKAGGCIRLCADEQVQAGLGLAEGIETALRVMADGWHPVWAAIDAGNMATWPVLLGVESLTLFADHDKAGLRSADTCRTRWRDAGRECRIVSPREIGADWADVVTS
ncbi:toprim domain-containing protein [Dongia sp.]|uniref:toprim domain-containing protein n=1 Tax=Dongia sp. TaxID=1977262 RepID=UPI0037532C12